MNQTIIKDIPISLKNLQDKILELKGEGKIIIQNGDIGYATAPSNIALLKYWGKVAEREQIPVNSSLSYTLGGFRSFTKVTALGRFFPNDEKTFKSYSNKLFLDNNNQKNEIPDKMDRLIKSILYPYGQEISFEIESYNNFPTACGIASSASGYAALVAAIADLLQLQNHFTTSELLFWLTEWARLGSGSATRSVVICHNESFIKWEIPVDHTNRFSFTSNLKFHPKWRQLQHCVFILDHSEKKTSSSDGHKYADTSPFQIIRISGIPVRINKMEKALLEFDFETVQYLSEEDAYSMHSVMQTGNPKACYLNENVAKAISLFIKLRDHNETKAFWTLDAGPNIHVLFMPEALPMLRDFHSELEKILKCKIEILVNNLKEGLLMGKDEYERISIKKTLEGNF
jgi:diphosphomevalonate decarboxylase